MAPNGVPDPEAVLSIDIGSTETRPVFAWRDKDDIHTQIVENRVELDDSSVNSTCQFSSSIIPNDDLPVKYLGNKYQTGREATSAKFATYVIVGIRETLREQYAILNRLLHLYESLGDRSSKDVFKARLKEGFTQLLRFVLTAAKDVIDVRRLKERRIRVKTVAMTVPSQWDLDFQDLYEELLVPVLREVFAGVPQVAVNDIALIFHAESTALAQYVFNFCTSCKDLALRGGMPNIETILSKLNAQFFVDCGGHNANGILTTFHRNQNQKAVLYEIDEPTGAGGGTEMWIQDLLDQVAVKFHDKTKGREMPLELRQAFETEIRDKKRRIMEGTSQPIVGLDSQTDQTFMFIISKKMSDKAFPKGFQHVQDMITGRLKRLSDIKKGWGSRDHIITIVVSGGSALHPKFVEWMEAVCRQLELPQPLSTQAMETCFGASRIAKGGAYATLTQMSVASFAEKCAFGLQKGRVRNQGQDDEHVEYEDSADTIWYQEHGCTIPAESAAEGNRAEYRIVCQPYLGSYCEKLHTDQGMAEGSSYDFLSLGTLPDGYMNRIELKVDTAEEKVELKITLMPLEFSAVTGGRKRQAALKETELTLGPFPVHVQPGTLCLMIRQSVQTVDKHVDAVLGHVRPVDGIRAERSHARHGRVPGRSRLTKSIPAPMSLAPQTAESSTAASTGAASTTVADINKAGDDSSFTNTTSASARGPIASKAVTARATNDAFRSRKAVVGNVSSNSWTEFEVTDGNPMTTSDAQIDHTTQNRRNNDAPPSQEAPTSRHTAPSLNTSETYSSASTTRKRPAPSELDDGRYAKRTLHQSGMINNDAVSSRQDASSRQDSRAQGNESTTRKRPAAPPQESESLHSTTFSPSRRQAASSTEGGRYTGSAFWGGNQPSAPSSRQLPLSRSIPTSDRLSSNMSGYSPADSASRRTAGPRTYPSSETYNEDTRESPVSPTSRRNPGNNVSLGGGPRPIGRAPPPPPRHGSAAPRAPPAGNPNSRSLPVRSPRPDSGARPERSSGPAGSSQHPRGFNGFDSANRGQAPRRSD